MNLARRWPRRIVAAVAIAAIAILMAARPASAHATLLFTTPAIDGTVPTAPRSVSLVFNEPVSLTATPLRVQDGAGRMVRLGRARLAKRHHEVVAVVTTPIRPGVYTVRWSALSSDGDIVGGEFRFGVGAAGKSLTNASGTTFTAGFGWTAVLRWLLFAGLALSLGSLVGVVLVRRRAERAGLTVPRPRALTATLIAFVAAVGLAAVVAGDGSPVRGATRPAALLNSAPGLLAVVEAAAFGLAGIALWRRRRRWAGSLFVVVGIAEGLRAHPQAAVPGSGALTLTVHVLAVAVWVGALVYVLRTAVAWRRDRQSVRAVFRRYARMAAWAFAVVVVTGTVNALLVTPLSAVTSTTYGRVLLVKLGLVAVVAAAALASRLRLRGRPDPGWVPRFEAGALLAVLAVTATLTVVAPPTRADAPLPFPPPPTGPALAVGDRAGTVGVVAAASAEQLVIHLSAPAPTGRPDARYRLTGNLALPNGTTRALSLRGCGYGCYLATARWGRGANTVTLRVAATGWPGGTVSLLVGWPIRPAPAGLVGRIAAAMRRAGQLTVYERVTSDTTQGTGIQRRIRLSGRRFLAGEPYSTGAAPTAALVARSRDTTTVALGYPGAGLAVLLTVDDQDRIVRETFTGPNHLIHRSLVYPEAD